MPPCRNSPARKVQGNDGVFASVMDLVRRRRARQLLWTQLVINCTETILKLQDEDLHLGKHQVGFAGTIAEQFYEDY